MLLRRARHWCTGIVYRRRRLRMPTAGQQQQGEQELATKMLQIQSKRFYLDVKQNRRGRFIKVAEIGADGRRSQIFLALSTAAEFRDHLSTFSDFYASLGPPNPENVPEDGKLKSEMMIKDNRRYYLDLKENSRGRFLRVSGTVIGFAILVSDVAGVLCVNSVPGISEISCISLGSEQSDLVSPREKIRTDLPKNKDDVMLQVSQTITRGGPRSQIAIPAQGMIEFRDALTDLLEEFGTDDGGFKGELPEGRHMRVENKNFYFDIGQNNRGIYMRISEVKTNFRTAITVPEKSWARFRDIFADYCEKMKEGGEKVSSSGPDGGPSTK
ncbi:hypothetical protein PR048_008665 [Dryococelus australis]|uniref:Transcriptional activator protein Pur-beta n=1 Tax=Dryococelus australis TaxID=614101 RepID=A0ABQ9HXR3_9NEOP|nr:hypothetical protein PR048_008665 [Dryococelus australis]